MHCIDVNTMSNNFRGKKCEKKQVNYGRYMPKDSYNSNDRKNVLL